MTTIFIIIMVVCLVIVVASYSKVNKINKDKIKNIEQTNKVLDAVQKEKERQAQEEIDRIDKKTETFKSHFDEVNGHASAGLKLEKAKDIEGAIKEYELAVKLDKEYFGIDGYEKECAKHLCYLYRDLERYDDELRMIHRVLEYGADSTYVHRMTEVYKLKNAKNEDIQSN